MNKTLKTLKIALEIIWLLVALVTLAIAVWEHVHYSFRPAIPFYAFAAVALFFFSSRRKERQNNTSN